MVICWLFLGPVYVTWAVCTWACQLCVYLCILDLAFDSLYEGTVLCLFEFVLWCFLLATTVLLERCFCYLCVMFLCLIVFTWACPSVRCRLWIFSMGRICTSILTQVTHVWLIFSFLVGRHFGLVGVEAFVEGLGLPLTWSMAVLDVLLLLFSMFLCKSNLHWFTYANFYALFLHLLFDFCVLFMHFLRTSYALFYVLFMHFLCTCYMHFFMHFVRSFYALFMIFLCAFYAPWKSAQKVYTLFEIICTFYALFKSA